MPDCILGINPFDQPDVESAKIATRALIDHPTAPAEPAFVEGDVEVRGTPRLTASRPWRGSSLPSWSRFIRRSHISIQASCRPRRGPGLTALRDEVARRSGRPVTSGGARASCTPPGNLHKGGPATGAYLQITTTEEADLEIPDRPFSLRHSSSAAQADGDAKRAGRARAARCHHASTPPPAAPASRHQRVLNGLTGTRCTRSTHVRHGPHGHFNPLRVTRRTVDSTAIAEPERAGDLRGHR